MIGLFVVIVIVVLVPSAGLEIVAFDVPHEVSPNIAANSATSAVATPIRAFFTESFSFIVVHDLIG